MWDFFHRLSSNYSTLPWGTGSKFLSPKDCMVRRTSNISPEIRMPAASSATCRVWTNVLTPVVTGRPENMPRKNGKTRVQKRLDLKQLYHVDPCCTIIFLDKPSRVQSRLDKKHMGMDGDPLYHLFKEYNGITSIYKVFCCSSGFSMVFTHMFLWWSLLGWKVLGWSIPACLSGAQSADSLICLAWATLE